MKGKQKIHVMVISDGPFSGSGFGEEIRNVFYRLVQMGEIEVTWFALTQQCFPIMVPDTIFTDLPHRGIKIRVVGAREMSDFGASVFIKHYLKYHPDIVLFMGDPRNIAGYVDEPFFWKDKFHFPLFMYVTLDGLPIHPSWMKWLKKVNVLIAMTEWAQVEYMKTGLAPAAIHHGVNWNWWANNRQIKEKLRKKYKIPQDCVVYLNYEVPQHRKRTDALLRCWKDFHPERKNAKLILYADWDMDKTLGWNIEDLIKQYGIPRETIISPLELTGTPKYWEVPSPIEEVREIARLADIYVTTTSGEGFGKCTLEAMSLRMPVIVTDYSACSEVCAKGSILVPTYEGRAGRYRLDDRRRSVEGGVVNEEKFTEAMLYLYNHEKERKELGKEARRWAREFDYDTKIIPQWVRLFRSVTPEKVMMKELLEM